MKYFIAANATRTGIPKFNLTEYCGTWYGVLATDKDGIIASLSSTPAVTEITEDEYIKQIAKIKNLPEELRSTPYMAKPSDITPPPSELKTIEVAVSAESVLEPVKISSQATINRKPPGNPNFKKQRAVESGETGEPATE